MPSKPSTCQFHVLSLNFVYSYTDRLLVRVYVFDKLVLDKTKTKNVFFAKEPYMIMSKMKKGKKLDYT